MFKSKKTIISKDPEMNLYAKLYAESLSEEELSESTNDEELLNTAFSTLLYFMIGDGNKVLKDDEWMNYLQNDINTAIQKGLFKPAFEDKQNIKKLQELRFGPEEDEDEIEVEDDSED